MTEQANTGAREDPAKKRREYLRKKAVIRSKVMGNHASALIGLLATTACVVVTCITLIMVIVTPRAIHVGVPVILALFTLLSALQTKQCYLFLQKRRRDDEALLYVPPVAEQLAALPAEAVLVRGSDEPAATPEELLRAAREGTATDTDELLRAESRTA